MASRSLWPVAPDHEAPGSAVTHSDGQRGLLRRGMDWARGVPLGREAVRAAAAARSGAGGGVVPFPPVADIIRAEWPTSTVPRTKGREQVRGPR